MEWHEFLVAALAAIAMTPLAFFFPDCPCCEEQGCGVGDAKPRTDPANEGTWVPSGTWRGVGGVTWSFTANPGDDSGETWFFFGSASTSKVGGGATFEERRDWGNICNWYSNKTTSPSTLTGLPGAFDKRATRLPPVDALVHVYTDVSTVNAGAQVVEYIYFWRGSDFLTNSEITSTASAHDSTGGAVFTSAAGFLAACFGTINGGATFNFNSRNFGPGQVNGGATFNFNAANADNFGNFATVNDGAVFNDTSRNTNSDVNGGAVFNDSSSNFNGNATGVNGGATFNDDSENDGLVNGGATFNDNSVNSAALGRVNDGATFNATSDNRGRVFDSGTFNDSSLNSFLFGRVDGGATFNNTATNGGDVNGGATFNDNSKHLTLTVNGGATFNDAAASFRTVGNFLSVPCDRKFVAHPTDLPVCNGTALTGCDPAQVTSGCN